MSVPGNRMMFDVFITSGIEGMFISGLFKTAYHVGQRFFVLGEISQYHSRPLVSVFIRAVGQALVQVLVKLFGPVQHIFQGFNLHDLFLYYLGSLVSIGAGSRGQGLQAQDIPIPGNVDLKLRLLLQMHAQAFQGFRITMNQFDRRCACQF